MTVPLAVEADILRLYYAEHFPVGTIAVQLGVHADVVRRVLGLKGKQQGEEGPPRPRSLEPYSGFIAKTLEEYPKLRSTRIYDMLYERGYAGSDRTVRRYVACVRPVPQKEVFLRIESLIGEQAQVDWAYVGKIPVPGGLRALWVFVMVLAYSRALWAELVLDLDIHSLRRSLVRAAAYFGGLTRQWLFDNPKTVVLGRHQQGAHFHPLLLELSGHLRCQVRLCAVRAPQHKGKVERSIRYLRDRFFAGRTLSGIESGNEQLSTFLTEIADKRPHPTIPGQSVAEVFAQERKLLLPLPDPLPSTEQVEPVSVDKTGLVHFDDNRYSVPPAHVHSPLTLVASQHQVRLLCADRVIATHPRCWGHRQFIEDPAHREQLLRIKQQARVPKGQDLLRSALPGIDDLFIRWVHSGANIGNLTLRTRKLLDLYGKDILGVAVTQALLRGTCDVGALAMLCEQQRRASARPVPIDVELGAHVPDRDVIPHPLEDYDAKR